jgi:hypothetical protein
MPAFWHGGCRLCLMQVKVCGGRLFLQKTAWAGADWMICFWREAAEGGGGG